MATARAQLEPATARTRRRPPVPRRAGDPSLIEHVVYIIKENRTYDQVFGDLPRGNGEPSLVMFGEDVTPNHRKLATSSCCSTTSTPPAATPATAISG